MTNCQIPYLFTECFPVWCHPGDWPIVEDYDGTDMAIIIEPYGWYFWCEDCDWYHGPFVNRKICIEAFQMSKHSVGDVSMDCS